MRLYRYDDPVMGPRRVPNCDRPLEGKAEVREAEELEVDLEKGTVAVQGKDVGGVLVYRVEA